MRKNVKRITPRAALLARGDTIAAWARLKGHDPELARRIIYRWSSCHGRPRGALTRAILRDLSLDLGISIPPGYDWADEDAENTQTTNTPPAGGRQ